MRALLSSLSTTFRALAGRRARLAARDEAILNAQVALARIPAPTGEEGERAQWVESHLRSFGLADVHIDDAGNVIGRRPGRKDIEPVVVCAHLDTEFPRGTK